MTKTVHITSYDHGTSVPQKQRYTTVLHAPVNRNSMFRSTEGYTKRPYAEKLAVRMMHGAYPDAKIIITRMRVIRNGRYVRSLWQSTHEVVFDDEGGYKLCYKLIA